MSDEAGPMEVEDAFERLGLTPEASPDDVRSAYREASRKTHPDMTQATGADAEQAELNEANRVALAYARLRTSVVPVGRDTLVQSVRAAVLPEVVAVVAANKAEQIRRVRSSPLRTIKSMAWIMSGISAALSLLADRLPDIARLFGQKTDAQPGQETILAAIAVTCAGVGLAFQMMGERAEREVDAYLADLDDSRFCAAELARLLGYRDVPTFTDTSLGPDGGPSPRQPDSLFLGRRGRMLSPLVLLKAREHGLIELARPSEITPESVAEYTLKFRPAAFAPEPPAPPKPLSPREAWFTLGFGAAVFGGGLLGASTLASRGQLFWAIVTGFVPLGGVGLLVEGVSGLRRARAQLSTHDQPPGGGS